MDDRIEFMLLRLREKLWVKPLVMCVLSIAAVFVAKAADQLPLVAGVPNFSTESIETLLKVISSSMLVMAIFAVGSMVSAYASASSDATPRTFRLVIADDVSQNALTAFIGAFIFSIIALFALQNNFYERAGRFTLLSFTFVTFAIVIVTFVGWVDRIARLGRLGTTIKKVESATATALKRRRREPRLGGVPSSDGDPKGTPVFAESTGYVQRVDVSALQSVAKDVDGRIEVAALPGAFTYPGRPVAFLDADGADDDPGEKVAAAFVIGNDRSFEDDPRFGIVVLAEIASRALSPAVNDPGSAIGVIGSLIRLFRFWLTAVEEDQPVEPEYDRVAVPELDLADMLDDAFTPIARDGAANVEVAVAIQRALESLTVDSSPETHRVACRHARLALFRAEHEMTFEADIETVQRAAAFSAQERS